MKVDPTQNHAVIVVKKRDTLHAFHLGWNRRLRFNALQDGFAVAIPKIETRRLHSIAAKVRLAVARSSDGSIPYGFGSPENRFSSLTMQFDTDDNHYGLTCATFVYSLLSSAGWRLIDHAGWQERHGDKEWRERMLGYLKNGIPNSRVGPVSKADYDNASSKEIAIRIRPTDLIAAVNAKSDFSPASFEDVVARTQQAKEGIELCAST